MMDKQKGKFSFECDGCGEVLDTGETGFDEAQAKRSRAGWQAFERRGSWQHFCPDCWQDAA